MASKDREYAIKAYKLVLCSRRPLYAHELIEAVSLRPDGSSNSRYVDRQYVLQICSNFLVTDHWTEVRFAHLSVIEFLKGGTFGDMFSDSVAHAQAAETCLSCLQPNARLEASKIYDGKYDAYFFSSYAGRYWLAHCLSTSKDERQHGRLGELFAEFLSETEPKPTFIAWMNHCRRENQVYQRCTDFETIASASLGPFFSRLAELVKNAYQSGNMRIPGAKPTALHHAVDWNSILMVSLLVENGADVNVVSTAGETPFHRAVSLGYDDIANYLANHDGNIQKPEIIGRTVSQEAFSAASVREIRMQALVDRVRKIRS